MYRLAAVFRFRIQFPFRDRAQKCVSLRKSNVPGPLPSGGFRSRCGLRNGTSRVLSGTKDHQTSLYLSPDQPKTLERLLPAPTQATQLTRQTARCAIDVFCPSPRAEKADMDP